MRCQRAKIALFGQKLIESEGVTGFVTSGDSQAGTILVLRQRRLHIYGAKKLLNPARKSTITDPWAYWLQDVKPVESIPPNTRHGASSGRFFSGLHQHGGDIVAAAGMQCLFNHCGDGLRAVVLRRQLLQSPMR